MTRAQRRAAASNAALSTGPRTPEGKAASSRNAIKHNLSGTTFVLLPGEDRAAFDALARDYNGEWKPRTPHESFLVTQMVQARWRLNRIARMEAEIYDAIFTMPFADGQTDEGAIVIAQARMNEAMLDKLHRYANDAERAYSRAVREIRAYRAEACKTAHAQERASAVSSSACEKTQNEPKPLGKAAAGGQKGEHPVPAIANLCVATPASAPPTSLQSEYCPSSRPA